MVLVPPPGVGKGFRPLPFDCWGSVVSAPRLSVLAAPPDSCFAFSAFCCAAGAPFDLAGYPASAIPFAVRAISASTVRKVSNLRAVLLSNPLPCIYGPSWFANASLLATSRSPACSQRAAYRREWVGRLGPARNAGTASEFGLEKALFPAR